MATQFAKPAGWLGTTRVHMVLYGQGLAKPLVAGLWSVLLFDLRGKPA